MICFVNYEVMLKHEELFKNKFIIYNLSSPIESIPRLNLFIDSNQIYSSNDKDFDIKYYKYIMSNTNKFMGLMSIIINLYYGNDVAILIGKDRENNFISESLQKLIQQRYGIISDNIFEEEDLEELRLNISDSEFSIQGLSNLDEDKSRYMDIMNRTHSPKQIEWMSNKLNNFGH